MVFEVFRKRQKEFLVALTLLAMFAFVFAGMLDQIMNRGSAGSDPVVATAWGEPIHASQVELWQRDRQIANEFVRKARAMLLLQPIPQQFDTSVGGVIQGITLFGKATRMGLAIDDAAVNEYINALTENRLSKTDFQSVLTGADPAGKTGANPLAVGERALFSILGRELMINQAVRALNPPVILDTPYEIWAKREVTLTKAQLDLIRVPVNKFVSDSEQPTPEQLLKVYEEFKDKTPDPEAGIVGFRLPHKVDVQYMMARIDDFLDKVTVTPEEIEKYYNANPEEFQRPAAPASPSETPKPTEGAKAEPATEAPPVPPESVDAPKEEAPKKESAAPTAPPAPPETEKSDSPRASLLPGLRAAWRTVPAVVGLFEPESQSDPAPEEKLAPDEKATAAPATETKSADPAAPTSPPPLPPPAVKPLEEVRADIEKTLRRQKAGELILSRMQKIVQEVLNPYLDGYLEARNQWKRSQSGKPEGSQTPFEPPPLPDIAKLAQENGFELKSTGLITAAEAAKLPGLSAAVRPARESQPLAEEEPPFREAVFSQSVFRSRVVFNADEKQYFLYWKTVDQPARVPPLEEIKDQVIAAWRAEQAVPKAKEAAEKLAEAVRAADGNMDAAFDAASGYTRATTKEFERFTAIQAPFFGQDRLVPAVVPEIPDAGPELLDGVFRMKVGEVGVFPDASKQNFYVIKVIARREPEFAKFVDAYGLEFSVLREPQFLMQRPDFYIQRRLTALAICREAGLKVENLGEREAESP